MNPFPKGRACGSSLVFRAAVRLAAAALTGCQGGRCVRTHDFAPTNDTALSDVVRCVVVSVPNEVTPHTFENTLRATVSLVNPPALAAGLRRVGRVDLNECHSGSLSLVGQKTAELGKRPRMQGGPLGLAKPYPVPDAAQLLDSDSASGAFSLGHDALADAMVDVRRKSSFFATALTQQPTRRTGFLGLQPFTKPCLSLAVSVKPCASGAIAVAGGCDVDDPQIDANKSIGGFGHRRFGRIYGGVEKPLAIPLEQVALADLAGPQKCEVPRGGEDPDLAQPSMHGPNRNRCFTVAEHIRHLLGQTARVERLRRIIAEHDWLRQYCYASPRSRWTIISGSSVRTERGVSVRDLADHPYRRLGRQVEPLSQLGVEASLRVMLAKYSVGMHLRRQPRRRVVASAQRSVQGHSLEPDRQYADLHHLLHKQHGNRQHRQRAALLGDEPPSFRQRRAS